MNDGQPTDHKSRLARYKILEAQESMAEATEVLRRIAEDAISIPDLLDFAMIYLPASDAKDTIIEGLIEAREDGGAVPNRRELEYQLRVLIPRKFEAMDNLTALAATRLPDADRKYESYWLYNPDLLVKNFPVTDEPGFAVMTGRPRTGKTNVACLALAAWDEKPRVRSVGNVKMLAEPPIDYEYATRWSQILRSAAESVLHGEKFLLVDDEGGLSWLRAEAMTKSGRGQDKMARVLNKMGGRLLLLEQRRSSVSSTVEEFTTSTFYTPARSLLHVDYRGPVLTFHRRLKDVPKTDLPYDPQDIAFLTYDLDVDALFGYLTRFEGGHEDQARRILDFLDDQAEPEEILDGWKQACLLVCKAGLSMAETGRRIGVSGTTIGRWLADHEHVFKPEPSPEEG